jgi:hypothetical protein
MARKQYYIDAIKARNWNEKVKVKALEVIPDLDFDDFVAVLDLIDYAVENDDSKCDGCERVDPDECYRIVYDNPPERW